MKKRFILLLFILSIWCVFSQNCEETKTAILNGEIYDYQLRSCTTDVAINTLDGNTNLHGITFIDAIESINLKPTENNKISIKPDDLLDFIDLLVTDIYIPIEDFLSAKDSRTSNGNSEAETDLPIPPIIIYPNPVDSILTVESYYTILYYKIVDTYGINVKKGTIPTNNQLELNSLTQGVYYLLTQIENEITVTRFYKN